MIPELIKDYRDGYTLAKHLSAAEIYNERLKGEIRAGTNIFVLYEKHNSLRAALDQIIGAGLQSEHDRVSQQYPIKLIGAIVCRRPRWIVLDGTSN